MLVGIEAAVEFWLALNWSPQAQWLRYSDPSGCLLVRRPAGWQPVVCPYTICNGTTVCNSSTALPSAALTAWRVLQHRGFESDFSTPDLLSRTSCCRRR